MYPLLVSAATTLASHAIENWQNARTAKAAEAGDSAAKFAALLEKTSAARPSAASGRQTQIATLRQQLLNCPEVSTLLASADPSKPPALTLGADGTLSAQAADGRTTTVALSPENASIARNLAALGASATPLTAVSQFANRPSFH
jgi:hypothetical protein